MGIASDDYISIKQEADRRRRRFAEAVREVEAEIAKALSSGIRLELTGTEYLCFADGTKSNVPLRHRYRVYEIVGEMFFRSKKEWTHVELELNSDLSARVIVFSKPVQDPLLVAKMERIIRTVFSN